MSHYPTQGSAPGYGPPPSQQQWQQQPPQQPQQHQYGPPPGHQYGSPPPHGPQHATPAPQHQQQQQQQQHQYGQPQPPYGGVPAQQAHSAQPAHQAQHAGPQHAPAQHAPPHGAYGQPPPGQPYGGQGYGLGTGARPMGLFDSLNHTVTSVGSSLSSKLSKRFNQSPSGAAYPGYPGGAPGVQPYGAAPSQAGQYQYGPAAPAGQSPYGPQPTPPAAASPAMSTGVTSPAPPSQPQYGAPSPAYGPPAPQHAASPQSAPGPGPAVASPPPSYTGAPAPQHQASFSPSHAAAAGYTPTPPPPQSAAAPPPPSGTSRPSAATDTLPQAMGNLGLGTPPPYAAQSTVSPPPEKPSGPPPRQIWHFVDPLTRQPTHEFCIIAGLMFDAQKRKDAGSLEVVDAAAILNTWKVDGLGQELLDIFAYDSYRAFSIMWSIQNIPHVLVPSQASLLPSHTSLAPVSANDPITMSISVRSDADTVPLPTYIPALLRADYIRSVFLSFFSDPSTLPRIAAQQANGQYDTRKHPDFSVYDPFCPQDLKATAEASRESAVNRTLKEITKSLQGSTLPQQVQMLQAVNGMLGQPATSAGGLTNAGI